MVETPPSPPPSASLPTVEPSLPATLARTPVVRLNWGALGIQTFAIFLSVVLGFAVTEWREARGEQALQRQALENFREELARNQQAVAAHLPYHTEVLEGFQRVLQGPSITTFEEAVGRAGFHGPRIVFFHSTALRAADATGALALLDFDTARGITAVYALQEALEETQRTMLGAALNPLTFDQSNAMGSTAALMTYFGIVVEMETELTRTYPAILALLDDRLGTAPAETAGG